MFLFQIHKFRGFTRCFECVGSSYASPLCPEYMLETAADVLAFEV